MTNVELPDRDVDPLDLGDDGLALVIVECAVVNGDRRRFLLERELGMIGDELAKGIKEFFGDLKKKVERAAILSGTRIDGRKWDDIREITIAPNFNPRQHGSVLFTRGETQALVSTTLGTPDDEHIPKGFRRPIFCARKAGPARPVSPMTLAP